MWLKPIVWQGFYYHRVFGSFDFQRYMQEQKPSFIEGDVFIDNNDYNGRIYAELKSKTYTDEETGQESEYREYEFKNLEGVPFFCSKSPSLMVLLIAACLLVIQSVMPMLPLGIAQ